ncbi:(Fe-S)-binding protein [Marinomonas primoryensis]|mgnify:FL=1|jgi:Fe-S oxidoreductase|uniref:(Fe-S)-binding protein n=1 Tax=Marinomonas primoryensis TaxID=178399 RepID=A0A2Z4PUM1_9GAMM|nr:(Fe-S)-binding protein [Marinomonas primoryensis]AWY01233.1 (Fe-S)-binding protein [Marinomonas primoryensis]|tara:strand:- start:115621 stop:117531 length:1911 start_codon:yes stop_codon:yes gene_type:complete
MILDWLPPTLIGVLLVLAGIGAVRRVNLWRAGQAEKVDLLAGLLAMPKRYLHDLHHVVERDKYMSRTHVATGGGFVLAMALVVLIHLFGVDSKILAWALLAALIVMFCGALFVAKRRLNPPSRLSKGPWMRLPKSLLTFSITFFVLTLPAAGVLPEGFGGWLLTLVLSVLILMSLGEMLFGMTWGGPMKHAFAGALHLAFHRRPERFGGGRSTGLKSAVLGGEVHGVAKPSDFKWNQLLGFDACVQCGRCEAVCPAFAAGQPLNPKKLIQDMVVGFAGGTDEKYAGSPYPGVDVGNATGGANQIITEGLIHPDTLWSCTTCRACVEECPMMIEHVDAIVDMRRFLTLEKGNTPNKGAQVLENIIATDNPNGYSPASRTHWAADQNLNVMKDVKQTDVLFWVSDGAFDMRSQRILRAFVKLLKAANVDVAILGDEELDSGDVARRLGDDATFQNLAKRNLATLSKYRFNKIVTTDPHAFHCLKNEYGDFGSDALKDVEVLHHTTFLNRLVKEGRFNLNPFSGGKVTYHDPCYLGRYNGEYEAPRELLASLGIDIAEMERSGYRSRCCGGGGGAPVTDIPGERRIADMRMEDVTSTGAELVAVGCQQCTAMLEGVVEPRPVVKDIAEILAGQLREEMH